MNGKKKRTEFLDMSLINATSSLSKAPDELNSDKLNAIIQDHLPFFQQKQYDLLLSANDRIMTCEQYLKENKSNVLSEIEIITFFTAISMLHDSLKCCHNLIWEINTGEKKNQVL